MGLYATLLGVRIDNLVVEAGGLERIVPGQPAPAR